jgi:hypothetical protein
MQLSRLLPIVAAVAEAEATGADLWHVTDLDALDLFHHVAVALEAGLVRSEDGRMTLTARGVAWADLALEPLGFLFLRVIHDRARLVVRA